MNATITTANLVSLMSNIKGATICTIVSATEPKMRKTANPYVGRVTKLTKCQYQFGYNYQNAVNNRLAKEGKEPNFTTDARKWGVWVVPNKVAEHKGEFYLRFYTMENATPKVVYLVDNRLATPEEVAEIKSFLTESAPSNRQIEAGLTEHFVEPREYKASAILQISLNGMTYATANMVEVAEMQA
jgi:hypothetical protein